MRQAVHIAVTAGALALPVSLALRDSIWTAAGLSGTVDTLGSSSAVVFAGMVVRYT